MTLAQLRRERSKADERDRYTRRVAYARHFTPAFLARHKGRIFSGGESITIESERVKYVRRSSPYWPATAGELARTYLHHLMRKQLGWARITPRYKVTERDARLLGIPAPLYFDPARGREGRFVYVDIAAAYFDLFSPWPLNASFNEETGAVGRPTPSLEIPARDRGWLRREKGIRHSMFGMMCSESISWWKDGKVVQPKPFLNGFSAPDLVALVKLSCHAIATEAVERFGCRMWLTDAGIFPEREGLLFQFWLADVWRLGSKPKAWGNGHLFAIGDYRIGRVASRTQHVDLPGLSNLVASPSSLAERRRARLEAA